MFKRYYGEFIVIGKENIPFGDSLIFAPNHINALQDAIAVHSVIPANLPLVFLARSDIFKNKHVAKFLNFAKIIPAFRLRDGIENLGKNNEIFNQCIDILNNNCAIGIMPEGNQEIERRLRPLVKGVFRIAFAAQNKFQQHKDVSIIPVGIDYGDLIKSNKHLIISIGKPIPISSFISDYNSNPVLTTNEIKDKLQNELSELTLDLATDNYYKCFERVVYIVDKALLINLELVDNTVNRFKARQIAAKILVSLEKNRIEELNKLDVLSLKYVETLQKYNLKSSAFENTLTKPKFILNLLSLVSTCMFFILGLMLNFTPFFIPVFIRKYILKPEFVGFYSSLQFGIGLITFPLFYVIQTLLFAVFLCKIWWMVLLFMFIQYPFGKLSLWWYRKFVKYCSSIRYLYLKKRKTIQLNELEAIYNQIVNVIITSK